MSSSSPQVVGTLVVVVMKARHLPNKRHIGKQDPYCTLKLDKETQRTKAVKKGGQHPEWDEEIRFSLYEDAGDVLARTGGGDSALPPVPDKSSKPRFNKNRSMRLACYADDPRDPELIGDVKISLEEVLTKGEVDEWFPLNNKDKYSGEVYLEMTFWSNQKAPAKVAAPLASGSNSEYGGRGYANSPPNGDLSLPQSLQSGAKRNKPSRSPSYHTAEDIMPDDVKGAPIPGLLRPADSLAKLDLYVAPWEGKPGFTAPSRPHSQSVTGQSPSQTRPQYDEFGAQHHGNHAKRRESLPPVVDHRASSNSHSLYSVPHSHSYSHHPHSSANSVADSMASLSLNSISDYSAGRSPRRSVSPIPPFPETQSYGNSGFSSTPYYPQQPQHTGYTSPDNYSVSSSFTGQDGIYMSPASVPFQSLPTGSSGFAPPPPSRTPVSYAPHQPQQEYNYNYSQTSASSGFYTPAPSISHSLPVPNSSAYSNSSYAADPASGPSTMSQTPFQHAQSLPVQTPQQSQYSYNQSPNSTGSVQTQYQQAMGATAFQAVYAANTGQDMQQQTVQFPSYQTNTVASGSSYSMSSEPYQYAQSTGAVEQQHQPAYDYSHLPPSPSQSMPVAPAHYNGYNDQQSGVAIPPTGLSSSTSSRPLPDPQQHVNQVHAYSQPALQGGGVASLNAPPQVGNPSRNAFTPPPPPPPSISPYRQVQMPNVPPPPPLAPPRGAQYTSLAPQQSPAVPYRPSLPPTPAPTSSFNTVPPPPPLPYNNQALRYVPPPPPLPTPPAPPALPSSSSMTSYRNSSHPLPTPPPPPSISSRGV